MMLQTGSCHCFSFLFLLLTLHLSPTLAYFLKDCTILYSDNISAGVSVDCDYCDVDSVPDDIPRDIISLTLQWTDIKKIHRNSFCHLSNLTYLDLSFNSITHVDDGAFVPLFQLKVLDMHDDQLSRLTDDMFQGLSNLLILRLYFNNIHFISPSAFQSLTSLQELNLECTQMADIITILQLPRLQVLNITITKLETFQSKDLPLNMSSELRELRIISKSIKMFSISTAVFPHVKTIDLSHCCSRSGWEWDIPDKYFLKNITTVYLIGYRSFNISKVLQSLDSLEYLELKYKSWRIDRDILSIICKISTLRTFMLVGGINDSLNKTLSPCTQLTNLGLSGNRLKLTELSKDSIKQMNQLSHLYLAYNNLFKVPDDVKHLSMLQILDLSYNNIHDLSCSDFLNLTRLTHLLLDNNHIYDLKPCFFQHLNELKVLTLRCNLIETYGNTFESGLHKLELLDLKIINVHHPNNGRFTSLKSLKHLDVEFIDMEWDAWDQNYLEGLDELETFNLTIYLKPEPIKMSSSPPNELQWQNYNTTILKSLWIRFDPLDQYFDRILDTIWDRGMKHLEHLNVYGEPPDIHSLKYVGLPQLKTLSIRHSNLMSLDFLAQANLTRLDLLDLRQNQLTLINVSVFSFLPALRFINMNDNPLACDCSNADFQEWMQNNNQTQVVDAHSYTCGFPLAKKGTRFLDFDYHSCWVNTSFICFISSTCVILLILLTSFTYHFLRLHLLYAYYLFLAFLYDAKERKRGSPQRYDAFISYNIHDELWVYRDMLPVLEGEQGWRLCLHHRDFPPGKPIVENIADAIYGSRKTICVISHHYLESEWCSREIQMASYRLFDEQKDVLILVFLEDIPAHQLSPYYHMKRLVKRHTYLSWSHAGQHPGLFWQNLRRALDTPQADLTSSI